MDDDEVRQLPYQGLAPIYDYVMRHVDYDEWGAFIRDVLQRHAPSAQRLIDLACGTGNVSAELVHLGYAVTGADASESMVRIAQEKAALRGDDGEFVQRDLRDLSGLGPFDSAVCMYDSFNYLLELEDIDEALSQVCSIVLPGGLFIFDVCTERNSLTYFSDMRDVERGPGFSYQRHSYYNAEQRLQHNDFEIRFEGDDSVYSESHVQRIYRLADIEQRIEASAFELVDVLAEFSFDAGSEHSDRVHYVLRAPSATT
jgi:SAM-dependent methyltransferase